MRYIRLNKKDGEVIRTASVSTEYDWLFLAAGDFDVFTVGNSKLIKKYIPYFIIGFFWIIPLIFSIVFLLLARDNSNYNGVAVAFIITTSIFFLFALIIPFFMAANVWKIKVVWLINENGFLPKDQETVNHLKKYNSINKKIPNIIPFEKKNPSE